MNASQRNRKEVIAPPLPTPCNHSIALLIKADDVSCWVAESRSDLGRIYTDRLHDLASAVDDRTHRCGYAINHHVKQNAWLRRGRAPEYPGTTPLARCVVERRAAIISSAYLPAEDPFIKLRRTRNVIGRHLDVADLSICNCRRHQYTLPPASVRGGSKLCSAAQANQKASLEIAGDEY